MTAIGYEVGEIHCNHSRVTVDPEAITVHSLPKALHLFLNCCPKETWVSLPACRVKLHSCPNKVVRADQLSSIKLLNGGLFYLADHLCLNGLLQELVHVVDKLLIATVLYRTEQQLHHLPTGIGIIEPITSKAGNIKNIETRYLLVVPHILEEIQVRQHLSPLVRITNQADCICINGFPDILQGLTGNPHHVLVQHNIENLLLVAGQVVLVPGYNLMVILYCFDHSRRNNQRGPLCGVRTTLHKITLLDTEFRGE